MSTEHQQYSIDNQASAIQEYAQRNSFVVVRSYEDPGRSGLLLKDRPGLRQLLSDVVSGKADYRAILVYDVSRWGRFQDTDEAAYYEFLCKRAGIYVHYCAEPFANDGTVLSSILKALKRSMAAEYSRELGVKVYAGKKRLALLGYRVGGSAGYGLRRMLLSEDGKRKQKLKDGEHKSLLTDRVILVPGPEKEVECVRLMFRMRLRSTYCTIAEELNSRGIPHVHGGPWTEHRVRAVLTNPKYVGLNVWGRTTSRLHSRIERITDPDQWVVSPTKFKALVDRRTFDLAQAARPRKESAIPDKVLLDRLRALLTSRGTLSTSVLSRSHDFSPGTYVRHFGSLRRAFELVGYRLSSGQIRVSEQSNRRRYLQHMVITEIEKCFPNQRRVYVARNRLALVQDSSTGMIPISICLGFTVRRGKSMRWKLHVPLAGRHLSRLICLSNLNSDGFVGFYLMPNIQMGCQYWIKDEADPFLRRGQRFNDLAEFCSLMQDAAQDRQALLDRLPACAGKPPA
jgi:DNA invertase Pin-like site-specific DNA recombinase